METIIMGLYRGFMGIMEKEMAGPGNSQQGGHDH